MNIPKVDVGGKRTLEYVLDCLCKINRKANEIIIRSIGGNTSKGMRVAQILSDNFEHIKIKDVEFKKLALEESETTCLEILLELVNLTETYSGEVLTNILKQRNINAAKYFITYPIYSLLIDSILFEKEKINIKKYDNSKEKWSSILEINKTNWDMSCIQQLGSRVSKKKDRDLLEQLTATFYRCGLLKPINWRDNAKILSKSDDIIVGVDTNILFNATLSEHILGELYFIDPRKYIHTPNWILIVIPGAVMHEIEQASNNRDQGKLTLTGRLGYRALGEIIELVQCADLQGISVVVFGEREPALDIRDELNALRQDLLKNQGINSRKTYTGDAIIRDSFKKFLNQFDSFKKSAFFITSDKTSAALAQAENLQSIYYKLPMIYEAIDKIEIPKLNSKPETENYSKIVPVGKLIYELAIQYGKIKIEWQKDATQTEGIELFCDRNGESIEHWFLKDLLIKEKDAQIFWNHYNGRFSLEFVQNLWEELREDLIVKDN